MGAANNISLPEPLLAEIRNAAQTEHRSADDVVTEPARLRSYPRIARSTVRICETLATESFANPVVFDDRTTLPGASLNFRLLVSGIQMTVPIQL